MSAHRLRAACLLLLAVALPARAVVDVEPTQGSSLAPFDTKGGFQAKALSGDGNTALVAAPFESANGTNSGAVYISVRSGSTWTLQAKLTPQDPVAEGIFGQSVSLSSDGNTAVVGTGYTAARLPNINASVAYVFQRAADSSWTQQAKLFGNNATLQYSIPQVTRLDLSGDGRTLLLSTRWDWARGSPPVPHPRQNASVTVLVRPSGSSSSWAQQATFDGTGGRHITSITTVSVSHDGDTALFGVDAEPHSQDLAYVYARSGSSWTEEAVLSATSFTRKFEAYFGSLSADGRTALAGGGRYSNDTGIALVYARSGSSWSHEASLEPREDRHNSTIQFGTSFALNGDGTEALVGASGTFNITGVVYSFSRPGATWSNVRPRVKIVPDESDGFESRFGMIVRLSDSGSVALVGAERSTFVVQMPPASDGGGRFGTAATAGLAAAAVVLVGLAAACLVVRRRRRSSTRKAPRDAAPAGFTSLGETTYGSSASSA